MLYLEAKLQHEEQAAGLGDMAGALLRPQRHRLIPTSHFLHHLVHLLYMREMTLSDTE